MSGPGQQLVETVDLLTSDEENDSNLGQEDVIELLDSDEDVEVIELLDSEDEDDVRITRVTSPRTQQQHQQQHTISMYVDGSHRPGSRQFNMAGGIWVPEYALSMARILQGGEPDSCRAELGAVYAAVEFLSTSGLTGITGPAARAAAHVAQPTAPKHIAVEVWILTDCQSCLDMLVSRDKVKQKYKALVEATRRLKAQLPFVVRIFKVQGHSRIKDVHAVGNKRAHDLAYKCDTHQPVCKLPA